MKLYFIVAEEGEMNLDWFVIAETPLQAYEIWKSIDTVQDFCTFDEDTEEVPKVEIFNVGIQMEGPARSYDWHTEVQSELEVGAQ